MNLADAPCSPRAFGYPHPLGCAPCVVAPAARHAKIAVERLALAVELGRPDHQHLLRHPHPFAGARGACVRARRRRGQRTRPRARARTRPRPRSFKARRRGSRASSRSAKRSPPSGRTSEAPDPPTCRSPVWCAVSNPRTPVRELGGRLSRMHSSVLITAAQILSAGRPPSSVGLGLLGWRLLLFLLLAALFFFFFFFRFFFLLAPSSSVASVSELSDSSALHPSVSAQITTHQMSPLHFDGTVTVLSTAGRCRQLAPTTRRCRRGGLCTLVNPWLRSCSPAALLRTPWWQYKITVASLASESRCFCPSSSSARAFAIEAMARSLSPRTSKRWSLLALVHGRLELLGRHILHARRLVGVVDLKTLAVGTIDKVDAAVTR